MLEKCQFALGDTVLHIYHYFRYFHWNGTTIAYPNKTISSPQSLGKMHEKNLTNTSCLCGNFTPVVQIHDFFYKITN